MSLTARKRRREARERSRVDAAFLRGKIAGYEKARVELTEQLRATGDGVLHVEKAPERPFVQVALPMRRSVWEPVEPTELVPVVLLRAVQMAHRVNGYRLVWWTWELAS